MRHRSRRPLLDTLWRPRVAAGLAALCVGGTGAALVADTSAEEHTADGPRAHRATGAPAPSASPTRTARPTRSGPRPQAPSATASTPAPAPPSATGTPGAAPSAGSRRPGPLRTHVGVRVRTPSAPSVPSTSSAPSRSPSVTADTTAPDTTLSTVSTSGGTAVFRLGSDGPATYECSVDGGAYAACVPALTLTGLTPGWHTLSARAVDPAGNVDPSPAGSRWHATAAG